MRNWIGLDCPEGDSECSKVCPDIQQLLFKWQLEAMARKDVAPLHLVIQLQPMYFDNDKSCFYHHSFELLLWR